MAKAAQEVKSTAGDVLARKIAFNYHIPSSAVYGLAAVAFGLSGLIHVAFLIVFGAIILICAALFAFALAAAIRCGRAPKELIVYDGSELWVGTARGERRISPQCIAKVRVRYTISFFFDVGNLKIRMTDGTKLTVCDIAGVREAASRICSLRDARPGQDPVFEI